MLHEEQETLMGDVVNLPYTIGRGGRDGKIENNVGIICQGIRMANHIYRQSALLDIKAKEGMKKKSYRDISETDIIKGDL